jgi:murein DD-endopeptidase MepM/ murein hydrolase activator NlpD
MKWPAVIMALILAVTFFLALAANTHASNFIWPVKGCPLTSIHGWNEGGRWHNGIDLGCQNSQEIVASKGGYVTFAGWDTTGYGNRVDIDDGEDRTLYGHLDLIAVWQGQWVDQGQFIGTVGNTGYSFGPHLHLEIFWFGQPVDPLLPLQ